MKVAFSVLIVAMLFVAYGCPPKPVYVPISERAGQPVEQEIKAAGDTQADRDRLAREKGGHSGGASAKGSGTAEDAPGTDEAGRCPA